MGLLFTGSVVTIISFYKLLFHTNKTNNLINCTNNLTVLANRQSWSTPEKEIINNSISSLSGDGSYPSLSECLLIEENPILKERTPEAVKTYVFRVINNKINSMGSAQND